MPLNRPIPFAEGLQVLANKLPVPSAKTHEEWADVPAAIRHRSFYAAQAADARFVNTAKSMIDDYLDMATYQLPDGRTAMKVGGRGDFVVKMKEFMEREGVERTKDETITDLGGSDRLRLIFDTQTRMAHDYGALSGRMG
jgi:uncharacterized protein with gpF-like domain